MEVIAGKKVNIDGHLFDSELEAKHYLYLKEREDVEIVKFQPEYLLNEQFKYYDITKNKELTYSKMIYTGDFLIRFNGRERLIVLEVKGLRRSDYMMRKKLFIKKYNEEVDFIESKSTGELHQILKRIKEVE